MVPVFLLCAAIIITLVMADVLSKAGAAPGPLQTDDRGFVDSKVRCDAPQSAVEFGRTEQSLIAICVNRDGHYEYRGARLGDDAVLTVVAEPTVPGEFFAQKDGVTYTVTAKELVIKSDEWVRTEPMLQFGAPPLLAVEMPVSQRR
ncbi:hypothetical protein C8E89_13739 [Mycolicibacterium moriokaense]|uniref:Serine/threonine protein kinase n=2 Tax=Mycolicibacterium moriokaense TaxID=39691 RepID=A0A318HBN7_9MYCO|nr:hypothetical protein C8E89_13739 [Mycolicibacterium moriokaense]